MTLSTSKASETFQGNSVTQIFPCGFRIFQASDISVSLVNAATGTSTSLALNSDYTLTGEGDQTGFTLSTVTPVATGTNLLVSRNIPYTQPTDFTNQGSFFPTMHEDMADRLGMQIQQLAGSIGRSLKMPDGITPAPSPNMPLPAALAPLVWSADGTALENGSTSLTGDMLLRPDLASSASGKGASLVGFQQQGAGALASNIKAAILGFFFTPQMFGAVGDGTADDTAAVQAWLNACLLYGYKAWAPAVAIGYRLTSTINVAGGVTIVGDGCEMQVGDLGTTQTRGRGSWFYIDHTGVGFKLNDPTQYRSGIVIERIGTVRNQPVTTGASFTPNANDFDFQVTRCDALLRDVNIYNATKGVLHNTGGYGRLTVERLRGQPLSVGIQIDDSADTCRFRDIHFWPFFSNASVVRTYMLANAKALILKDVDNPDISGFFTIGYFTSLSCEPATTTNNMPVKIRLSDFDFDNGAYGIRILSGGSNGVTMLVSHGYILGGSTASSSSNISVEGNNNTVLIDNVGLDLPQLSNINVAGTGNKVRVGNISLDRWNYSAGAANGVTVATGNTARFASVPVVTTAGTTNPLFSTTGTISSPLSSGQSSGTTNAGGIVTLTHGAPNAPRHVNYAHVTAGGLLAKPTGTYTATTFDLEIRNITNAGAVQASYGVTVDWAVSY